MASQVLENWIGFDGTPCPDWSSMGENGGNTGCGITLSAFLGWGAITLTTLPSLKAHENVTGFMGGLLVMLCGYYYDIDSVQLHPYDVSLFKASRPRTYIWMTKRAVLKLDAPLPSLISSMVPSTNARMVGIDDFFCAQVPGFEFKLTPTDVTIESMYND
eukprot:8446490-Karenia_brevis.AAC.1